MTGTLAVLLGAQGFLSLRVLAVDRLTDDSVAVEFAQPEGGALRFAPGQHLTVRRVVAGVEVRRPYSLCTGAGSGRLRIAVKRLPGGALSPFLVDQLRPGAVLEVLPPTGSFGPRETSPVGRRYACLAAGSGITPIASIVATVLETEPSSTVSLVLGNRTTAEVMLLEELADLKDAYLSRFQLLHVLSREEQPTALLTGRLDAERVAQLLATLLPPETVDQWFLCGPFEMVNGARGALLGAGVDPARVHLELFHAEPSQPSQPIQPQPGPRSATTGVGGAPGGATVQAALNGRSTTVQVPAGSTVLDAVLAVRADAPYACRGGVCGTCRARVLVGAVQMAVTYALEPDELAAGIVLTCQAQPTTPVLRLEYL